MACMHIASSSKTLIGVAVAVAGNVTISVALNCQKLAHLRLEREQNLSNGAQHANSQASSSNASDSTSRKPSPRDSNSNGMDTMFLRSKLWWLGIALMTLGEGGNFLSYGFAPASLVAPLGAVALLSNVIISPILLQERFRPVDIGGILLAIIGAVTVVFSSKQNDVRLGPDGLLHAIKRIDFVIYASVMAGCGSFLAVLSRTSWADRLVLIDIGTCAIFGGFTVLATKGISSLISGGRPLDALRYPITYCLVLVLAATAVIQITFLNRALQRFDSRQVIPTQFVLFTISAIVGSAILYRDFENMDAHRLVNFLFGCLTTFAGVFALTWRNGSSQQENDSDAEQGDESQHTYADDGEVRSDNEDAPLLAHLWHGNDARSRADGLKHSPTSQTWQRLNYHESHRGVTEPGGSSALRVPGTTDAESRTNRRPRSRTNSPHKSNTALSRSFGDRSNAGGLSRSATHQPKISLIGMDRPTGLSPGHYLLLATPPPSFSLNPVNPSPNAGRAVNGRVHTQYGAISSRPIAPESQEGLLPFPTTTPGNHRAPGGFGSSTALASLSAATPPVSNPTAAESIVTSVAETSGSATPVADRDGNTPAAVALLTTQTGNDSDSSSQS
ncbi:DUF803-domain-containing protein [Testicularia cyperi]|uniref:DUF803-domain-containing protein n=1 Tax=Testicularia cyperi TaxID=1882483 RepID=A0A317XUM8_9BASI|nr:DUF803-domain-containing protein [Testicularia cyperi]